MVGNFGCFASTQRTTSPSLLALHTRHIKAYPASQAYRDISKHGTIEDLEDMEEFIRQEKEEEKSVFK
jgi:hypothetical protein